MTFIKMTNLQKLFGMRKITKTLNGIGRASQRTQGWRSSGFAMFDCIEILDDCLISKWIWISIPR